MEVAFIAVGTPSVENGSVYLRYVLAVADQIGKIMTDALVLITEWTEFCLPNREKVGAFMKTKMVFDGRNLSAPFLWKRVLIITE